MIPGLALVEKVGIFAIDMIYRKTAEADQAKSNFQAWLSKSGKDAKKSTDMRSEYDRLRKDDSLWQKDKSSKS